MVVAPETVSLGDGRYTVEVKYPGDSRGQGAGRRARPRSHALAFETLDLGARVLGSPNLTAPVGPDERTGKRRADC